MVRLPLKVLPLRSLKVNSQPIIYQCVTNDLSFDQRLLKKTSSLRAAGYDVRLIGRRLPNSPSKPEGIPCTRFRCWINAGVLFYIEINLRIFFFLIFKKWQVVVANDADTLLACGLLKMCKGRRLVYDSHELFTEVPELQGKNLKRKIWHWLQKWMVPKSDLQITVGPKLAIRLSHLYGGNFLSVRNMPFSKPKSLESQQKLMLYQGALNTDRGIELSIQALTEMSEWKLWIAGKGPKEQWLRSIAKSAGVADRVTFLGNIPPDQLSEITCQATVGLNLLRGESMNYKFFDYVQAEIPGISMAFPEYKALCEEYPVAILLENYSVGELVEALRTLEQTEVYQKYQHACREAAQLWIWPNEAEALVKAYQAMLE